MKLLNTVISKVKRANSTETTDVEIGDVLYEFGQGSCQKEIAKIRQACAAGDIKTVKALKSKLPAVTFSGRFKEQRRAGALLSHSGYLCADLDDVADVQGTKAKLIKVPSVFAAFVSPTGCGLKAVFRVPAKPEAHLDSFRAVKSIVKEATDCSIDESGKDIPRLCFYTHDPDIFINLEATEIHWTHNSHTSQALSISQTPLTVSEGSSVPLSTPSAYVSYVSSVESAIDLCIPVAQHTSHRLLCKLAGALKAYIETSGDGIARDRLRVIHRAWFEKAKRFLDPGQSEADYFLEFLDAWKNAKPLGEGRIDLAWRLSQDAPTPPELIAADLSNSPRLVRLAAFLCQLQTMAGDEPFFVSPYKIMQLFKQGSASNACYWLSGLCECGILTRVERGSRKDKRASSYRYNFSPITGS